MDSGKSDIFNLKISGYALNRIKTINLGACKSVTSEDVKNNI